MGGDASSVVMRELMHEVTLDLLKSNPAQAAALKEIMQEFSERVGSTRYFGEHGLEEFVADVWPNRKVIDYLKSTQSDKGAVALWDRIVQFFNNLFSNDLFGGLDNKPMVAHATQELMRLLETEPTERQLGYYFEDGQTGEQHNDAQKEYVRHSSRVLQ